MLTNFEIIKSEFITYDYNKNSKYIHWSRIFEWTYVIDSIEKWSPKSIHNTACGGLNYGDCLHLTFCTDLEEKCQNVTHSDKWGGGYIGTELKPKKNNFIYYDITEPFNQSFDMVLNISTIEHLSSENRIKSLENLIKQVNINGHLILTFDYPDVNINDIESFFNIKINKKENYIKNNMLSVILIHLIRKN